MRVHPAGTTSRLLDQTAVGGCHRALAGAIGAGTGAEMIVNLSPRTTCQPLRNTSAFAGRHGNLGRSALTAHGVAVVMRQRSERGRVAPRSPAPELR